MTGLEEIGDEWELKFENGEAAGPFDRVLVTAPAPQTADLLGGA